MHARSHDAVATLRTACWGVPIVVLGIDGATSQDEIVAHADSEVAGFLAQDGDMADLREVVAAAASGETLCSPHGDGPTSAPPVGAGGRSSGAS